MNILIIGGTRLSGVHLVKKLLRNGHRLTVANRGKVKADFGAEVETLIVDRTREDSLREAFAGRRFDAVFDSVAYCSNHVKLLLDNVETSRYVFTSSCSVYPKLGMDTRESAFDPLAHGLVWRGSEKIIDEYDECKRQAECAVFAAYGHIPAAATRFPYIVGVDDYTKRLYFYAEHIAGGKPMNATELEQVLAYVRSDEAGEFNAWLVEQNDVTGSFNAGSHGGIKLSGIIAYIEEKSGRKAIIDPSGDDAPYNGGESFTLNLEKAGEHGFKFSRLEDWIYGLLDEYVVMALRDASL